MATKDWKSRKERPGLLTEADVYSRHGFRELDASKRSEFGQFPTPPGVAAFMASMFESRKGEVRILDAGAGTGSLTAAIVSEFCSRDERPLMIDATTYEIDPALVSGLFSTLELCERHCAGAGVAFRSRVQVDDFIAAASGMIGGELFDRPRFDCAILNPPYRKIGSHSEARRLLRAAGVETTNLYTGFLALTIKLLEAGGELVAITPRSFCNGPYFRPFRKILLSSMDIRQIHLFESREKTFSEDEVLQENIIIHARKVSKKSRTIKITASVGPGEVVTTREVTQDQLVIPGDLEKFIHLPTNDGAQRTAAFIRRLSGTLANLGISVSTGRVVDFRCAKHLLQNPTAGSVPLIYPAHFSNGWISWPKVDIKKPNALLVTTETEPCLIAAGVHVLVKRFSAKEEPRRVVAAIFSPDRNPSERVAFENHLNYFHISGGGLPIDLAKGLCAYLNSTLVDEYFRQFNGHTQVNATDLRSLPYPRLDQLRKIGAAVPEPWPAQESLDEVVRRGIASDDETI